MWHIQIHISFELSFMWQEMCGFSDVLYHALDSLQPFVGQNPNLSDIYVRSLYILHDSAFVCLFHVASGEREIEKKREN